MKQRTYNRPWPTGARLDAEEMGLPPGQPIPITQEAFEREHAVFRAKLGSRFAEIDIDAVDQPPAVLDRLRTTWFADPTTVTPSSSIILGAVGTGKTFLAASLAAEYYAGRPARTLGDVRFLHSWQLGHEEPDAIEAAALVVLDDVGSERRVAQAWYGELIDRRWLEHRATIITSNLDMRSLAEVVGPRGLDRLGDDGGFTLTLPADSRRVAGWEPTERVSPRIYDPAAAGDLPGWLWQQRQ